MSSRRRALRDAQDAPSPQLLIPCKDRPRQYTPPGGNYTIVQDGTELLDVLSNPGSSSRLIRVSDATKYLDLLEPFVVPAGGNVTVDCQGAVVDLKPPTSSPGGTELRELLPANSSWNWPGRREQHAGVHYEQQKLWGGNFLWRNVSQVCGPIQDLEEEIRVLETPTRTAPGAESSLVENGGGGGAAVAAWVIMLLTISGVALVAMLCLCCVAYFVVRRRRRDGLAVDVSSKSGDDLGGEKVWGTTRYAESSETFGNQIILPERPSAARTETHANQQLQNLNLNLKAERSMSSTSCGADGCQLEQEIDPVSGEPVPGGGAKRTQSSFSASDEQTLRMMNMRVAHSGGSFGNAAAPHSGRSVEQGHSWIRTAPAATTAASAAAAADAADPFRAGGTGGSTGSTNTCNRGAPSATPHPSNTPSATVNSHVNSATRYSRQTSTPEAAFSREDDQPSFNRTTGSQYHEMVKFTGTSSRRNNPHLTHLTSSHSAAPFSSSHKGSSIDGGTEGGLSPLHQTTHLHHVAPIIAPKVATQVSGGTADSRFAQTWDGPYTESVCSPMSAAASLFTSTRTRHIPHEHMTLLQRLHARGPNVWRASWKDVPATVQDFTFEISDCSDGDFTTDSAAVFAGAVIAANMSHSHVINTFVHEVTQELDTIGSLYNLRLVQELCLGGTLAELMSCGGFTTPQGGIHIRPLLTVLRHVASGLVHLHRLDLTCGDLDPSQVLLYVPDATFEQQAAALSHNHWTPDSASAAQQIATGECKAKLANFGWSHAPSAKCRRVMPRSWNPTKAYWAPERRSRSREVHHQGGLPEFHVYSFGCILWELYCGREARTAPGCDPDPELGRFPGSTPIGYVLLTTSCLSPDPAHRPTMESVVQVLADLEAEIRSKYYTDLCGTPQKVDRLAYKLDRKTLMNPDFAMSSCYDTGLPDRANGGLPHSPGSNRSGEPDRPSIDGAAGPATGGSPRPPLPKSVSAILHSVISHHPPEQ